MDWDNILPILVAILAFVGLPLAFRSRKKGGPKKVEELCQHLQGIGVKASVLEESISQDKVRKERSWKQKPVGVIKLSDRNIYAVNVIGVASRYGVQYYLDFLVRSSSLTGQEARKRTTMKIKKSSSLRGKVVDIEWKGDAYLSQKLNFDYRLRDNLLQADLKALGGRIAIFPEPKYGHVRIRTTYFLPAVDLFEAIDIIARHIKSGW